jgi:hypothetical protein
LQQRNHITHIDFVTQFDLELCEHACVTGRNFHRGLVGFNRHERLFGFDGVTHFDQKLNHRNIFEIADVRHPHLDRSAGLRSRRS